MFLRDSVSNDFNINIYTKTSVLLYKYHSYIKLTAQSQILFQSLSADVTKPNSIMTRLVFIIFKINYFVHAIAK